MHHINQEKKISLLNLDWEVSRVEPDQGVWATLEFSILGAKLRVYDDAPDGPRRSCRVEHSFPLKEPTQHLRVEFQQPIPVELSRLNLAANLFHFASRDRIPDWISAMV
jgi:hypothetical protein